MAGPVQFSLLAFLGMVRNAIRLERDDLQTNGPDAMLREAARILKPGGRIGMSVWGRKEASAMFTLLSDACEALGIKGPEGAPGGATGVRARGDGRLTAGRRRRRRRGRAEVDASPTLRAWLKTVWLKKLDYDA